MSYVGQDPVNWVDPLGFYGTTDCSYYRQACEVYGGAYECKIANIVCDVTLKNNDTSDCIRQCLQEKAKERQNIDQCIEDEAGQTTLSDIISEHAECFTGCFINPENPYDKFGPDLPDSDIKLY